jgi:hypothetical protein
MKRRVRAAHAELLQNHLDGRRSRGFFSRERARAAAEGGVSSLSGQKKKKK